MVFLNLRKLLTQPVLTVRIIHLHLGMLAYMQGIKIKTFLPDYISGKERFVLRRYISDAWGASICGKFIARDSFIMLCGNHGTAPNRWIRQKTNNYIDKVNA